MRFFLPALVALAFAASPLTGFTDDSEDTHGAIRDVNAVLDVNVGVEDQFEAVGELTEKREWDRLMERLARINAEAGDSVWAPAGEHVHIPVRNYIGRLILTLPEGGVANYRARYDAEVRELYDRAARERSIFELDAVARRFPASSYAVPALNTAARLLMDRGEYGAAAARLNQLVNRPEVAGETAEERRTKRMASVKLAFCRARLGDASGAERAIARLKEKGLNGELRLAGGDLTVAEFIRQALDAGPMDAAIVRAKDHWPGPGGHIDHSRPMAEVQTDLAQQWWTKIGEEPDEEALAVAQHPAAAARMRLGRAMRPAQEQQAIVATPIPISNREGVIYLNTGEKLMAINHITGRLRWLAEPADPAERPAGPPRDEDQDDAQLRSVRARTERALWLGWQGAATVSSGGDKVFATEILDDSIPLRRALSAFDAINGKRLWSIVQQPEAMVFAERVVFPWAPTYVEGRLITLASYQNQMFLCALDAHTGELVWKQFLAADPIPPWHRTDIRRLLTMTRGLRLGQPVVISDGMAYGATGVGAVGAVDIKTGDLCWVARYDRTAIKTTAAGSQHRPVTHYSAEGGWEAGFPVIDGGNLYVAPWDSQELLVFDARSGELIAAIPGDDYTLFAGLYRGKPILSGEKYTAAVDPHTGRLEWKVPTGVKPSGMPILTESSVVVPGCHRLAIIRLDRTPVTRELHTIGTRSDYPSESGLGNLLVSSGHLVAVNQGYASGFFPYDKIRAKLTRLVEEQHPPRVKPLLERSDISSQGGDRALSDGERAEARDRYRRVLEDLDTTEKLLEDMRTPPAELVSRHKSMIFETRLKLAETDTEHALAHIDAAQQYIYSDLAKARFHLKRGAALTGHSRYQDAVNEYRYLVDNKPHVKFRVGASDINVGPLAEERISELVSEHGHEVYAHIDQMLRPEFERLIEEREVEGLLTLQAEHPHSSLADHCLLQAGRLVQESEHGMLHSQTILRSLTLRYPESELLGEAFSLLLENCIKTSQYRLAAVLLGDIADKHPDIEIVWHGETLTGEELVAGLMEETEELTKASGLLRRELPVLTTPLTKVWESGIGPEILATVVSDDSCLDRGIGLAARVGPLDGRPASGQVTAVRGEGNNGAGVQVEPRHGRQAPGRVTGLRAFYTSTGETLWQKDVNADLSQGTIEDGYSLWGRNRIQVIVVCSGSVMVLCHPDGILALEMTTGRQLWQHTWSRPLARNSRDWLDPEEFRRIDGQVRLSVNPRPTFAAGRGRIFYYLPNGRIGAVEASTGRRVWGVSIAGYATGPIGLLGNTLIVGTIEPNRMIAFNIRNGQTLHSMEMPDVDLGVPAYDVARRRVFTSVASRIYCYRADDFELLWQGKPTPDTLAYRPWSLMVLPDGNVVATKRVRLDIGRAGMLTVLYDAESGRSKWDSLLCRFEQHGGNREQVTMSNPAMLGEGRIVIPAEEFFCRRENVPQSYQIRQTTLTMKDYETGKTIHKYRDELPAPRRGDRRRSSIANTIAMRATTGHVVMMSYKNIGGRERTELSVVNAETGELVFQDELPAALYSSNQNVRFYRESATALVTADGYLIVPTGEGLRGYGPAAVVDNQE